MTKTQLKSKAIAFTTLVNQHLEIISEAQDTFDSDIDLESDENLAFLQELVDTDEDLKTLNKKYNELLEKIDF